MLWLVSGGSNISLSVKIINQIPDDLSANLTIMLADERYGEVDHQDSNQQQLLDAGFEPGLAQIVDILQPNMSFYDTEQRFRSLTTSLFDQADIIIAQLGIGEDGHIAGILPNSRAAQEETDLVVGYSSKPYERLTLSFAALRRVDSAYVFAFGPAKLPALNNLKSQNLSLEVQPAQILKQINQAYVYNDLID